MMTALRLKFNKLPECKGFVDNLVRSGENVFFVEHTPNDSQWGDGGDGTGSNMLGKLLTQILLEIKEQKEYELDRGFLGIPNSQFVDYGQ